MVRRLERRVEGDPHWASLLPRRCAKSTAARVWFDRPLHETMIISDHGHPTQRSILRHAPGFRGVRGRGRRRQLPSAAGQLGAGDCRHRRLDQGNRQRTLQGGQHGRRQRHLGGPQQRRTARPALRVRRRRCVRGDSRLGHRSRPGTRWRRSRPGSAEELQLELRTAIVPMDDIRAQGLDVRVARFQASSEIAYAMFTGGGASWAEAQMKAGKLCGRGRPARHAAGPYRAVVPVESDRGAARRNRFDHCHPRLLPAPTPRSGNWLSDVVALAGQQERGGHPVPAGGPHDRLSAAGMDYEARAAAPKGKRLWSKARHPVPRSC